MGGMIWGIASALHEAMEIDEHNGRAVNDNLAEYVLAVHADIPDVDIIVLPERDEQVNALGDVGKFEAVSGGGEMDHAEEAVGKLVIAGGDSAVDFEMAQHALDAVALVVERSIMLDLDAAV